MRSNVVFDDAPTQVFRDSEDITDVVAVRLIPSLDEVEAIIANQKAVSIAYYDPYQTPDQPWIWLETPNMNLLRVYHAMDIAELTKTIENFGCFYA